MEEEGQCGTRGPAAGCSALQGSFRAVLGS